MNLDEALGVASASLAAGRPREAERVCTAILGEAPEQPTALLIMGLAAHRLGLSGAGIELVRKALAKRCDRPEFHAALGHLLLETGRRDEAAACFGNAVALGSDPAPAEHLASLYTVVGQIAGGTLGRGKSIHGIPEVHGNEIIDADAEITLRDVKWVHGNASWQELVLLMSLCRKVRPRVLVEIGTFDGKTTLQFAMNTPPGTKIFTLDLPLDTEVSNGRGDNALIGSPLRGNRRFHGTKYAKKIIECFGNSLEYDFAAFTQYGRPDFIFIDAGHHCCPVKNRTIPTG